MCTVMSNDYPCGKLLFINASSRLLVDFVLCVLGVLFVLFDGFESGDTVTSPDIRV